MIKNFDDFEKAIRINESEVILNEMQDVVNAEYVSVWDGSEEVRTKCKFNTKTKVAFDIEQAEENIEDLDVLTDEYVVLPDGEEIRSFKNGDTGEMVGENQMVAEDRAYYEKEGYVEDPEITDEKTLLDLINKNISKAWKEFIKKNKIEHGEGEIIVENKRISLDSQLITGKDLGVFEHGMKEARLTFFSGKEIRFTTVDGAFLYDPRIWTTLNISYTSMSGGTNGVDYVIEIHQGYPYNDINYHIKEGKWYTKVEWHEKNKKK